MNENVSLILAFAALTLDIEEGLHSLSVTVTFKPLSQISVRQFTTLKLKGKIKSTQNGPGGLFAGLLFAVRCLASSASALSEALSSLLCLGALLSCTTAALSSCLRVTMEALMAAATARSSSSLHKRCFMIKNRKVKK